MTTSSISSAFNSALVSNKVPILKLDDILPKEFLGSRLFDQAMMHKSAADSERDSNERLEFLGDAVLQLVVTKYLFSNFDDLTEGRMTKIRAVVVGTNSLAEAARKIALNDSLRFVPSDMGDEGVASSSMLADTFEALVAAIYLFLGMAEAETFVLQLLGDLIQRSVPDAVLGDFKSELQERLAASDVNGLPRYEDSWVGPDHDRTFISHVFVGDTSAGSGIGKTKKEAQQNAAMHAIEHLFRNERRG